MTVFGIAMMLNDPFQEYSLVHYSSHSNTMCPGYCPSFHYFENEKAKETT